jgi:hypothetical protein
LQEKETVFQYKGGRKVREKERRNTREKERKKYKETMWDRKGVPSV